MQSPVFVALLTLSLSFASHAAEKSRTLTVSAGDHDRTGTIVSFKMPKVPNASLTMRDSSGNTVPLQFDNDGNAVFIEPGLKKGESKKYQVTRADGNADPTVEAKKDGSVVKFTSGGKIILHYQMQPSEVPSPDVPAHFRHGAYLHPVFSPSGKLVTADYPSDHRWQRGIWLAWTLTDFEGRKPDFWNMGKDKDGKMTGAVEFDNLETTWSGAVHGGFRSKHKFVDWTSGDAKPVLNETWEVTIYRPTSGKQALHVFDLTSTQVCAGSPVKFPKYHYGGLGVRGSAEWDPVDKVSFLTSNGDDRKKGDGTKANWLHMGGQVQGELTGIGVLIHPDNFRSPQPLRVNPKNPQLCVAPSADGDWEITPGKPYVSKYRFVVADGAVDAKEIERLWNDYAHPPKVDLGK